MARRLFRDVLYGGTAGGVIGFVTTIGMSREVAAVVTWRNWILLGAAVGLAIGLFNVYRERKSAQS